jgi:superoxide dismutase
MFRSYDHLQVEIYTTEINMTGHPWTWSNTSNRMQTPKFKIINTSQANRAGHVNLRCINSPMKMVVRSKHVADNLNKIVNNCWNRVALEGNLWTWSNTSNKMQTPKFKQPISVIYTTVTTMTDTTRNLSPLSTKLTIILKTTDPLLVVLISDVYISSWRWSYDRNK